MAMKAVVRMVNGNCYEIVGWPDEACVTLGYTFTQGASPTMTLQIDGTTVHLARSQIAAVELSIIPPEVIV